MKSLISPSCLSFDIGRTAKYNLHRRIYWIFAFATPSLNIVSSRPCNSVIYHEYVESASFWNACVNDKTALKSLGSCNHTTSQSISGKSNLPAGSMPAIFFADNHLLWYSTWTWSPSNQIHHNSSPSYVCDCSKHCRGCPLKGPTDNGPGNLEAVIFVNTYWYNTYVRHLWSSGYDVSLTRWRSPVRSWPGVLICEAANESFLPRGATLPFSVSLSEQIGQNERKNMFCKKHRVIVPSGAKEMSSPGIEPGLSRP